MPLLFCLAVHNALVEVWSQLLPGEHVFAFLDDINVFWQNLQGHAMSMIAWRTTSSNTLASADVE